MGQERHDRAPRRQYQEGLDDDQPGQAVNRGDASDVSSVIQTREGNEDRDGV